MMTVDAMIGVVREHAEGLPEGSEVAAAIETLCTLSEVRDSALWLFANPANWEDRQWSSPIDPSAYAQAALDPASYQPISSD